MKSKKLVTKGALCNSRRSLHCSTTTNAGEINSLIVRYFRGDKAKGKKAAHVNVLAALMKGSPLVLKDAHDSLVSSGFVAQQAVNRKKKATKEGDERRRRRRRGRGGGGEREREKGTTECIENKKKH